MIKLLLGSTSDTSSQIPAALAAATHVDASRFVVKTNTLNSDNTGRVVEVRVLDAGEELESTPAATVPDNMPASQLWQKHARRDSVVPEYGFLEATNSDESAASVVAQLEAMANSQSSTLKTGPLASLHSIAEEAVLKCSADTFYSCVDQTCMPKTTGQTDIPSGGQCCSYNTDTDVSKVCPSSTATAWEQSLTKCVAINNGADYSCSTASLGSSYGNSGASKGGTRWVSTLVLLVVALLAV